MENNSKKDIEIRRCRDTLSSIGTGIALFSVWSVFKGLSLLLIDTSDLSQQAEVIQQNTGMTMSANTAKLLVIGFSVLWILVDFAIRFYIGRSAIAVSKGQRRSGRYIRLTCLLICFSILAIVFAGAAVYFAIVSNPQIKIGGTISAGIIELTSLVLMIELVAVSGRLRKLTQQEVHDAA